MPEYKKKNWNFTTLMINLNEGVYNKHQSI